MNQVRIAGRSIGIVFLCVSLSACALPVFNLFGSGDTGQSLSPGETATVHFFTDTANQDTGVSLVSGAEYAVELVLISNWVDSYIEENETGEAIDETGFANSVMPLEILGVLRRSRGNRWFELMLYQPDCGRESLRGVTELEVDETNNSYQFTASCDGKLSMFVNDSPGFYGNNMGYANINLSRIN